MNVFGRTLWLVLVAGAVLTTTAAAQRLDPNLRLPPGWSDAYFEHLDEGVSPKTVVAVMDFSGGEVLEQRLRFRMSDMLITALVKAGRFNVVERDRLEAVMREQEFQRSGSVDPFTAVTVGRLLGAELVVFGLVTRAADQIIDRFAYDEVRVEVAVDVRAVNVESGEVVFSETADGVATDRIVTTGRGEVVRGPTTYDPLYLKATAQAVDSAGALLATTAPLIGFVISVQDGEVILDLGEERGVSVGDAFIAFRRGEELRHPVTGASLGWNKTVLAAVEIIATERTLSTGRVTAVKEQGATLAPGDLVMYRPAAR